MINLASEQIREKLVELLEEIKPDSEPTLIQRSDQNSLYLISEQDYQLFLKLIEDAEDQIDIKEGDFRLDTVEDDNYVDYDDFFDSLETANVSIRD
ncbi:hypothetical protein PCC7418_2110 [Halothece sp. PCC 7418]|uniref:hypothetical protein n=1 Tax=Halothece sp. (strain PCC 7418) TaxID=65093 RepID=UPI0002A08182|nr:hypothetical protein [Halothece sp. PCC 7418]AFZ44272.1 hypothetical protein PCC7418_2110 [Halothece sp. PCC 7418]